MKKILIFTTLIFSSFYSNAQLEGLWVNSEHGGFWYIEDDSIHSHFLDGRGMYIGEKFKYLKQDYLKVRRSDWKYGKNYRRSYKKEYGEKIKRWSKRKYKICNDTLFYYRADTLVLIKSSFKYAFDHKINSHGVSIDLPNATSLRRRSEFNRYLDLYVGFDSTGTEKIIVEDKVVNDEQSIHNLIMDYKKSVRSWQRIQCLIYCDKNVKMGTIQFIESILEKNDLRGIMYVAKPINIKPYDVEIRGVTSYLNPVRLKFDE